MTIQIVRYGIAGSLAFSVDVSILYLMTEYFFLNYLISAAIGFTAGMSVSYLLDAYWVFNAHTLKNRNMEFLIFFLLNIVGLGINVVVIWLVTEYGQTYYMLSKIVASFFVYCWNFFSRKYVLFNPNPRYRLGVDPALLKNEDS